MTKKLIGIICVLCIALTVSAVYAGEVTVSVSYISERGEITVSGNADGDVSITVTPDELNPENMSVSVLPTIIKQIKAKGKYQCTLGMPLAAEGGKYTVYVSSDKGEASDSFIYMNKSQADEIISLLKSAETKNKFNELILDNTMTLGIDAENSVFNQKKDQILQMLYACDFEDAIDFNEKYHKIYALCAINAETPEIVKALLEKYQEQLGLDFETAFTNESRMDESAKDELLTLISKTDFTQNIHDFSTVFESLKPLATIRSATNWAVIKNAITDDFANEFSALVNDEKYRAIKDKDRVFEIMINASYPTAQSIETEFFKAVKAAGATKKSSSSGGSSAVTVPVSPSPDVDKKEQVVQSNFPDLSSDHWGAAAVEALVGMGALKGYENGMFLPTKEITRAEFAKLVVILAKDAEKRRDMLKFSDVSDEAWYFEYIKEASEKNLINGNDGNFMPDSRIKREDAALIIYRLLDNIGKTPHGTTIFADKDDISEYATEAVEALGAVQIVQGDENKRFNPQKTLTRIEAAQIINNALLR